MSALFDCNLPLCRTSAPLPVRVRIPSESVITFPRNPQYVAYYDHEHRMIIAMRDPASAEWIFKRLSLRVNWESHPYITMHMDQEGHLHVKLAKHL